MMCSLWGRLPGVCGGASRPHLQLLCPSLGLPTPATKHLPSTPATHTHHGIKRTFCTNFYSSSPLSEFGAAREGRGVWAKGGCVWGVKGVRGISLTAPRHMFWEKDPKGGYGKEIKKSHKELIRDGLKELRQEMSKWQEEMNDKFDMDPIFVLPGDMHKVWVLDRQEALDKFVVTCDSDHGEGKSSASLTLSPSGHGLFSGELCTEVPKDGRITKAGYCNLKSIRPRKSFKREVYHNWIDFNMLEIRLRGDGRSYLLNITCSGYYDLMWNDIYTYPLYTRGGPHWQLTRIPFSKFILSSKGRVQDKQSPMPQSQVVSVGISAGDRSNAPFRLEIDYIGVYKDPDHTETFAYEMYTHEKFMLGS
ncbi:complex I intermediate-associated protein 30, mitochondrial-like isoform X1 [Eriocheir sinensis]|uniref:complex I intermediate-associated protein 30, mitochondrial-like isoform X1 n=1 Tax=Eriocheir sinensis TaxID=95602 RepID=UPI0021C9F0B0|nr:complex I intermediate-associated protein 30, mitochondrial-like isoform X1 [Eriocheir sinensis]